MGRTEKGALIGGGSGVAVGALAGGSKGALIGGPIGALGGAAVGAMTHHEGYTTQTSGGGATGKGAMLERPK